MKNYNITFPGGKDRIFTLSYDDGLDTDEQLIELLKKYDVKCTFNLNGGMFGGEGDVRREDQIHFRLPESRIKDLYSDPHCEVATHGYVHPRYETLTADDALADILNDRRKLESLFGRPVRGHAYPYGTYSAETLEVFRLAGIAYARTSVETHKFDLPRDWLRWNTTCHHSAWDMPELIDRFLNEPVPADENGKLFYIWGHTCEFRENDDWHVIEDILSSVSGREDVWYAANIEIYEYVTAWRTLVFSADRRYAYNPSSTDLWIKVSEGEERRKFRIPSGGTVKIG
ncbi:MAG: polysaccharide deacetylase family protein [Clostridia bacterium]|nr:polysaccharide deacetylase family protein [Clostridia bacterium]